MPQDKPVKLDPNQEYHYTAGIVDTGAVEEVSARSILQRIKQINFKNVPEILGGLKVAAKDTVQLVQLNWKQVWSNRYVKIATVILAVIAFFKVFSWGSSNQNDLKELAAAKAPVLTEVDLSSQPANVTDLTGEANGTMNERVTTLERATEYTLNTLEELNERSKDNQRYLSLLGGYTAKMSTIWQDAVKDKRAAAVVRSRLIYTIYSMSAERAWLIDQRGNLVSVQEGSRLPGYGKVLKLQPRSGRVITENAVIRWEID